MLALYFRLQWSHVLLMLSGIEWTAGVQWHDTRQLWILTKMDDSYLRTIGNFYYLPRTLSLCIEGILFVIHHRFQFRVVIVVARSLPRSVSYSCCTVTPCWIYPS